MFKDIVEERMKEAFGKELDYNKDPSRGPSLECKEGQMKIYKECKDAPHTETAGGMGGVASALDMPLSYRSDYPGEEEMEEVSAKDIVASFEEKEAKKMAPKGMTQVETPEGVKAETLPRGWSEESAKKWMETRMGSDVEAISTLIDEGHFTEEDLHRTASVLEKLAEKHPFTKCMEGVKDADWLTGSPEAFCAWMKDVSKGTTKWRKGRGKKGSTCLDKTCPDLLDKEASDEEVSEETSVPEQDTKEIGHKISAELIKESLGLE